MAEIRTKVIGGNIDNILPNTKKYFRVVILTNTESDYPLTEYLKNNTSLFCKQYELNGAIVDCDYYFNSSYGIGIFYYMAELGEGSTYNDKDFANSEASSFVIDINEILAGQDPSDHPYLHVFDYTKDKSEVIDTINRLRKDVVFKSDLYAGRLLGDIVNDLEILFGANEGVPVEVGQVDLNKETENAETPIEHYLLKRDNLQRDIEHKTGVLETLKAEKAKIDKIIESMGGDPYKEDKNPNDGPIDFLKEVFNREVTDTQVEEHKEKETEEVKPVEEPAPTTVEEPKETTERQEKTIEDVENILKGLDVSLNVTEPKTEPTDDTPQEPKTVKEQIEEETQVAQNVINNVNLDSVPERVDVTKELLTPTPEPTTEPDNVSKDEATIYDNANQGRNLEEYVEKLISSDDDFSGDWDDEQELFQIVMTNDNKAREELSRDEYKAYLDLVTRYSLNKNDRQELSSGVYNLRKAKFDNIGAFGYVND